jgi:hypothetical protein
MPQKIQPMGLVGRRKEISAPNGQVRQREHPCYYSEARAWSFPGRRAETSSVRKSSKWASAISATHTARSDQASQAAVRRLIPPTLRPCSIASFVTTSLYSSTVSKALRQLLREVSF